MCIMKRSRVGFATVQNLVLETSNWGLVIDYVYTFMGKLRWAGQGRVTLQNRGTATFEFYEKEAMKNMTKVIFQTRKTCGNLS